MSLSGALEGLLLQFIGPYVEGISLKSLHSGLWRGSINLEHIKVKRDLLALFGIEGLAIDRGEFGVLRICVPVTSLWSGKITVEISGLNLHVEQTGDTRPPDEIVKALRKSKESQLEVRVGQLRDLQKQREAMRAAGGEVDAGAAMKIARKFINNITIRVTEVAVSFGSNKLGFAFSAGLPELAVLSTGETFRDSIAEVDEEKNSSAIYKLVRVSGLFARLGVGDNCTKEAGQYIITPTLTTVQLAHEPEKGFFKLRVCLGTDAVNQYCLSKSQVARIAHAVSALDEEQHQLRALLVSPQQEQPILRRESECAAEYGQLFYKTLELERQRWGRRLDAHEAERMQLLEDVLACNTLAAQRCAAQDKFEHEHPAGRSMLMRMFDPMRLTCVPLQEAAMPAQNMFADVKSAAEFERLDVPQEYDIKVQIGELMISLVDDSSDTTSGRQLLDLAIKQTEVAIGAKMGVDYRGVDSAALNVEALLGAVAGKHAGRPVIGIAKHRGDNDTTRGTHGARLTLENKLEKTYSILTVDFNFAPHDIHLHTSMVKQMIEFAEPFTKMSSPPVVQNESEPATGSSAELLQPPTPTAQGAESKAGVSDKAGDGAGEENMSDQVSKRLPERLSVSVTIASPTVYVPLFGVGTAKLGLGRISLSTPTPCEVDKLNMSLTLADTHLRVSTDRGDDFDVLKPMFLTAEVQQSSTKEEMRLGGTASLSELQLLVAPQALQVVMSIIAALAPPPDAAECGSPHAGAIAEIQPAEEAPVAAAGADAPKRLEVDFSAEFDGMSVRVADTVAPIIMLNLRLPSPGVVLHARGVGDNLTSRVFLPELGLGVEALNPRSGVWEPLLEEFRVELDISSGPAEDGAGISTLVRVVGQRPLLLNVVPSMIKNALMVAPLYVESLEPKTTMAGMEPSLCTTDRTSLVSEARYRVLNLSDRPFDVMVVGAPDKLDTMVRVDPTGSEYASLDEQVVAREAQSLKVAVLGGAPSEFLFFAQPGAVKIPGCLAVAELCVAVAGYRLLVIGTPFRIHNQTDVSLHLRFHDDRGQILRAPCPPSLTCDGALFGFKPLACEGRVDPTADQESAGSHENELCLPPNALCAVPPSALLGHVEQEHAFVSAKLAGAGVGFSAPSKLCRGSEIGTLSCKDMDADHGTPSNEGSGAPAPQGRRHRFRGGTYLSCIHSLGRVSVPGGERQSNGSEAHIRYQTDTRTVSLPNPATPTAVATWTLKPSMTFINALPFGDVTVRYLCGGHGDGRAWHAVRVPKLSALSVYDVSARDVDVALRLQDDVPWSAAAHFPERDLTHVGVGHHMDLRQRPEGAAAGVLVETTDAFRLRVSCPVWFIDRSGLPGSVRLRGHGAELPMVDGITLLPKDCFDKPCELALSLPSGEHASQSLRMPPDFCQLLVKMPFGMCAFCAHTDDVAASGVMGAQCKVITLRPLLVVTNASPNEIELRYIDCGREGGLLSNIKKLPAIKTISNLRSVKSKLTGSSGRPESPHGAMHLDGESALQLAAGESRDVHIESWHKDGKIDIARVALFFRLAGEESEWSGPIPCSEQAAGSHPFLRPAARNGDKNSVWTAGIAPSRGSLTVTFRPGSTFVAANRTRIMPKVNVAIRPLPSGDPPCTIQVPFGGKEVDFGWADPLGKKTGRGVEVVLSSKNNQKVIAVEDVRRSMRRIEVVGKRQVAICIARVREKTVLTVEDCVDGTFAWGSAGGSTLEVELKLSRLGISIVQEVPQPRELLFVALDFVRLDYKQCSDVDAEEIRLLVSDIQAACQTPERIVPGEKGHVAMPKDIIGIDRKAVILGEDVKSQACHFLDLLVQREATSSQDLILGCFDLDINGFEVMVDDGWLDPLLDAVSTISEGVAELSGIPFEQVVSTAGKPLVDGYVAPEMPPVVQIESLRISEIGIKLSASVPIRMLDFLPSYLRGALCVLCLGDHFSLNGATLKLDERKLPAIRGSIADFAAGLGSEYTLGVVSNIAGVLGKSSLVNLPAVPLKLGSAAVSLVSEGLVAKSGKAAAKLGSLALGKEYAQEQQRARDAKQIRHAGDGVLEAGKSLAQGLEGTLDIFRKPIEGARTGGIIGLGKGLGQGLAGAVVKPIIGVGGAVSDLGSGVAATLAGATGQRHELQQRCREPRLLYNDLGEVRPFLDLDAVVLKQLGPEQLRGACEVIQLSREDGRCSVMVLFRHKILVTELTSREASSSTAAPSFFAKHLNKSFKPVVPPAGRRGSAGVAAGVAHELALADVIGASYDTASRALLWQDRSGAKHRLPLDEALLGDESRAALAAAVQEVAVVKGAPRLAEWRRLREARCSEKGIGEEEPQECDASGQYVLEVVEVQRRKLVHGAGDRWVAPYLPIDRGLAWRWVDPRGSRHPNLPANLSQEDCAAAEVPPCELDKRFKPQNDWKVQTGERTDAEGWVYGMAWAASNWAASPGLVCHLRKRLWVRTFS